MSDPDGAPSPEERIDLLDWRRRIFELYAEVRALPDPRAACTRWRQARDELFLTHPQSPLPPGARTSFRGLPYFEHDGAFRVLADVAAAEPEHHDIATSGDGSYGFTRFAVARFDVSGRPVELDMFWLDGYGGGLFVPFRDATAGSDTYGAGRYLLDTVKGSDLGVEGDRIVLDFNFAYNPSCAYDPRWVCPLAPPGSRIDVAIRAGERYG